MSEIKRATLISFGADKGEDKKQKTVARTVRISFVLPESNEGTCPVYNYKEELAVAKKKDKIKQPVNNGKAPPPPPNGLDPFDDDDDDVRRIAQEMEAKYGMGPPTKKKPKGRKDDYADIGMGYDESDSFIDNTDGYDEIIPQNVTTLHGGFYINCGALEFKNDEDASSEVSSSSSSSSSDEGEGNNGKPSRKRILETSDSEGETETEKGEKVSSSEKKQQSSMLNGIPAPKRKKLLTPERIKLLKKGASSEESRKKTVKDLLKEKREVINIASPPESISLDKADKSDVAMKENKKPMSMHNVADIIENVAKGSDNNNRIMGVERKDGGGVKEFVNKDVPAVTMTMIDHSKPILIPSSEGENSRDSSHEQKTDNVQLPENLPEVILELITKLKETASRNTENKVFTSSVNKMLLSLERKCRCLGKQSKSRIYQHLGPYLKCRKETLIRRAKNLFIEDDMVKLKELVFEMKSKINQSMPPLLDNYEKESQKVVQKKFSRETIEVEENKQIRMPKRRFAWTEEIKKLLKEIVTIRRRHYMLEGKNKEQLDIQMNLYLKSEIQILWPDGWMSMAALLKIYNAFSPAGEKKPHPTPHKLPPNPAKDPPQLPKPSVTPPVPKPSVELHPIKDVQKLQNNVKSSNSVAKDVPLKGLPLGAKEMQKLATNSMLSITPVNIKAPLPTGSPKPVMNDLTINALENDRIPLPIEISKNSGISISATIPNSDEPAAMKPDTVIAPAELIKSTEKPAKYANPFSLKPDNWTTIKPMKPPTDHKIENIIKPTKPENLSKPKMECASPNEIFSSPENFSKPKLESKKESSTKPKLLENLSRTKLDHIPLPPQKPKLDIPLPPQKPKLDIPLPPQKPKPENLSKPKMESVQPPLPPPQKSKPENLSKPKPDPSLPPLPKSKPENLSRPRSAEPQKHPEPRRRDGDAQKHPEPRRRDSDDVIIIDELSASSEKNDLGQSMAKENRVIDLTSSSELKRKPGPKSKNKFYDPSMIKPVKSASAIEGNKMKTCLLTGNSSVDNILQDNISDTEHFYNNTKKLRLEKESRNSAPAVMLPKGHNDGDDIQKVMEDLMVLQKMSAPTRSTLPADSVTSSPVSVISFNKSYAPKSSSSSSAVPKTEPKQELSLGFQEAFQRQFLNDLKNSLTSAPNTPTSSKGYNSAHSSSTVSHPEKYYMNANNNYAQQNASKYKTNYTTQQQGTFNLMDDMLANFISEYAYPKTANHKPKPQQK